MRLLLRAITAFMALLLMLLPYVAHSAVVEVRPTLLTITPSQRIAILSLVNPDAKTVVYQMRLYRWQQMGDKQTLEPTNDVIASPPIVTLTGHGSQIVRVGARTTALPGEEETYRLILEEVPSNNNIESKGLNIALRISLPLFVRPQATIPPAQLAADVDVSGQDAVVTVHNKGGFTARIVQVSLQNPVADADKLELKNLTYILPGGWNGYHFTLSSTPASFHDATVTLQTDEGDVDLKAPVVFEAIPDASAPAAH